MTHRGPFQPLPFCDSVTLHRLALDLRDWENIFEGRAAITSSAR